jgi:hypothetical protein
VRAAWIAMELIGWYVIVPLSLAALLSGVVQALGTPWGLFRHYWVLITFLLTSFATIILLLHMPSVSALADVAREADSATLDRLGGDLFTCWRRPAGVARDHSAQRVQAAGLDPVRVAEVARAAYGVAAVDAATPAWPQPSEPSPNLAFVPHQKKG